MSFENKPKLQNLVNNPEVFNNQVLKGIIVSNKIDTYLPSFRKFNNSMPHQDLKNNQSGSKSKASTKPSTAQHSNRRNLTRAETHRQERLKIVQFQRIRENEYECKLISKIQEAANPLSLNMDMFTHKPTCATTYLTHQDRNLHIARQKNQKAREVQERQNSSKSHERKLLMTRMGSELRREHFQMGEQDTNSHTRFVTPSITQSSRFSNPILSNRGSYNMNMNKASALSPKLDKNWSSESKSKKSFKWIPNVLLEEQNVQDQRMDLPLLPQDMHTYNSFKSRLDKSRSANLVSQFKVSTKIDQKGFYDSANRQMTVPVNLGKTILLIMDSSKLSVEGMESYIINLELGEDDNLVYAKNKILTKINTEIRKLRSIDPALDKKELNVIKSIKFIDGTLLEDPQDLVGACDVFIVSSNNMAGGLDWDSISIIPDIEKLERIFNHKEFAFKIFVFLGKNFIENLKSQKKLEIQNVKMAEIIYEDFEKIQSMQEQYQSDVMNIKLKYNIDSGSQFNGMLDQIKNNCSLMCDLIDDLLNISRKEKDQDIANFDRTQVNFSSLGLVMLTRNNHFAHSKESKYKFNRLYELLNVEKSEIIYRTKITLILLQKMCSYNTLILDDKIDKLIKYLLNDYELSINQQHKQLKNENLREQTLEDQKFLEEIAAFEEVKRRFLVNNPSQLEKDMQEFNHLQGKGVAMQLDKHAGEDQAATARSMDQINACVLQLDQARMLDTIDRIQQYEAKTEHKLDDNDFWEAEAKRHTDESVQLENISRKSKTLNEQQMAEQVEQQQRLGEEKLNKMADKLNLKKHKIHELTCLQKSMIQVTAADEKAKRNNSYTFRLGVSWQTFKASIQKFSLEDDEFVKSIFKKQANKQGQLEQEEFLQLISSIDQPDIEGKVEFFMKIADDNGTNTLEEQEVRGTCQKVIEGIIKSNEDSKDYKEDENTRQFVTNLTDYFYTQVYKVCGKQIGKGDKIIKDDLIEAAKKDPWNYRLITILCSA